MSAVLGLTLLFALGLGGSAIEYSQALEVRNRLQMAVDQGAQAAASLSAVATQYRIDQANRYFDFSLRNTPLSRIRPVIEASEAGVTVSATYNFPTTLLRLWRVESIALHARSDARSQI